MKFDFSLIESKVMLGRYERELNSADSFSAGNQSNKCQFVQNYRW